MGSLWLWNTYHQTTFAATTIIPKCITLTAAEMTQAKATDHHAHFPAKTLYPINARGKETPDTQMTQRKYPNEKNKP